MNTMKLIEYLEDSFPITTSIENESEKVIYLNSYKIKDGIIDLYFNCISKHAKYDTVLLTYTQEEIERKYEITNEFVAEILDKLKNSVHIPNSFIFEIANICEDKNIKIDYIDRSNGEYYHIKFKSYTPEIGIYRGDLDTKYKMSIIYKGCNFKTFDSLEELKEGIISFIDGLYEGEIRC